MMAEEPEVVVGESAAETREKPQKARKMRTPKRGYAPISFEGGLRFYPASDGPGMTRSLVGHLEVGSLGPDKIDVVREYPNMRNLGDLNVAVDMAIREAAQDLAVHLLGAITADTAFVSEVVALATEQAAKSPSARGER